MFLKEKFCSQYFTNSADLNVLAKMTLTFPIAVYFIRGDYPKAGRVLKPLYFINILLKFVVDFKLKKCIFSDDIEWVRTHASNVCFIISDEITYINNNHYCSSIQDCQLMTCARLIIYSMSDFAELAFLAVNPLSLFIG